ncbi:putative TIR domain-containing protein [Lupinus albus]|uniref:Putative TIR domain-containing protein n=1 Tax=Lupinus albus TaxID=3870 RepID=A0A6A4NVI9_LUPAL|nr:putative TIR domain-containing protein [Lupinus albus]
MKPGDKLFDKINSAVFECKIGVAVFSPRYCESYFCLHELALLMGCRKKIIPIFCDVKPSQLKVVNNGKWSVEDFRRFRWAIEEAKSTVGLTFNSSKGYIYIQYKFNHVFPHIYIYNVCVYINKGRIYLLQEYVEITYFTL